jgi:hypothetical protein
MFMKLTTSVNVKHFTHVTYSSSQNKLVYFESIARKLACSEGWYSLFCQAVSYIHKMFIKTTTGVKLIKLFFSVTDKVVKKARVFVHGRLFQPGLIFRGRLGIHPLGDYLKGRLCLTRKY